MFHKLKSITPLADLCLLAEFQDGTQKKYDVKPLMQKWPPFHALDYIPRLFEQVRVDAGCFGISWNDYIDLSCDELYNFGSEL